MGKRFRWSLVLLSACLILSFGESLSAQETGDYTVVAVLPSGAVVLRGPNGVLQYDVPPGTMFSVDGKDTSVADLRPGMKVNGERSGIASWNNTAVTVNEELNAQIVAMAGNSMLIRGQRGVRKYEWSSANDIHIFKGGKEIDPLTLKVGDVLTGMIVTKAAPSRVTSSQTSSPMASASAHAAEKPASPPAKPAAAVPPPAPAPAAAAPAPAPAPAAKKLPKTGSSVPLAGLLGAALVSLGAATTAWRRRFARRAA